MPQYRPPYWEPSFWNAEESHGTANPVQWEVALNEFMEFKAVLFRNRLASENWQIQTKGRGPSRFGRGSEGSLKHPGRGRVRTDRGKVSSTNRHPGVSILEGHSPDPAVSGFARRSQLLVRVFSGKWLPPVERPFLISTRKGAQEFSDGSQARPVSSSPARANWVNPSHERRFVCQSRPSGPKRAMASPLMLRSHPSGFRTSIADSIDCKTKEAVR